MMTPGPNRINSTLRLNATFSGANGALFDPDSLVAKVFSPSGQITAKTYGTDTQPVRASLGQFYVDVTPTEAGRWYIRWQAIKGSDTIVLEDDFIVQVSPFVKTPYESRGDYQ